MNDKSLVRVFLHHLAAALAWGIVALAVFFGAALGIKQEFKEAIQYTAITFDTVMHRPPLVQSIPDITIQSQEGR